MVSRVVWTEDGGKWAGRWGGGEEGGGMSGASVAGREVRRLVWREIGRVVAAFEVDRMSGVPMGP